MALSGNEKLPEIDRPHVENALKRYRHWLDMLINVKGENTAELVHTMVRLLNEYRLFIDTELIFDSQADFLYRQKGQLKLDNTVIEEFLPILVGTVFSEPLSSSNLAVGPSPSFSGVRFESDIQSMIKGGGITLRVKDQDFAISRKLYLQASLQPDFSEQVTLETNIAYVAAECKTNLDKTMFQEAAATALDVKQAVPGAKYFLLCEWLDMTPISTATTAIDEIIILRKQKRISANQRQKFDTVEGRRKYRDFFRKYLTQNPFAADMILRFLNHIALILVGENANENDILTRGYF